MKNSIASILFSITVSIGYAQTKGINYKAKLADNTGNTLANQNITVQFSIYKGNMGTTLVYQEEHSTTTDVNGIIILNIGEGANLTGDFTTIHWGFDAHWLKTEVDTGSGLVEIGFTEFKTVPYALHANTVEDPGVSSPFAEASSNLISANNTVADFLVGSTSTEDQNNVNFDARLFWDDSKAAFRAGSVDGTQWNDTNRGLYSFAAGQNNTASAVNAVAFGENNLVQGSGSVAFGRDNTIISSGSYSVIIGFGNYISGAQAIAIGHSIEATGNYSFAGGNGTDATAEGAFSFGGQNMAQGNYTTVFGYQSQSHSASKNSFTAGYGLENQTVNGTVIGEWNELDTNALLNIGNGNTTNRKTAFRVRRNGDVLIDNLSGTGTRPVYVNGSGMLTTQHSTQKLVIGYSQFHSVGGATRSVFNNYFYINENSSSSAAVAPVMFPKSARTIKKVTFYVDDDDGMTMQRLEFQLYETTGLQNEFTINHIPLLSGTNNTDIVYEFDFTTGGNIGVNIDHDATYNLLMIPRGGGFWYTNQINYKVYKVEIEYE